MSYKKVAVIGASGNIGKPVVNQLAAAGFDLTLISRDPAKLKSTFPTLSNTKFVEADLADVKALEKAFSGSHNHVKLTVRN
jgi:short-subunit dehydrogenase